MFLRLSCFRVTGLLCVATVLTLAMPALADDAAPAAEPRQGAATQVEVAEPAPPVAAAGLVAYIDPVTGGHTSNPTDEQRAAMAAALANTLSRSQEGLVEVVLPDGSVMVDLQGRFQNAVVVRRGPDGTLTYGCVTSPEAATDTTAPLTTEPAAAVAVE
jgi:hypothetical protein